jgi:transcription elongation factor GreB
MSKAFTKEKDTEDEDLDEADETSPLPSGGKNYITPAGADKLKAEYQHLKFKERPEVTKTVAWAASNGDRSENADYTYGKKRLREIDRRLRFLGKRIDSFEIVDPTKIASDQVLFGATVTIRDEDDKEKTYSIVGIDEVDLTKGRISWISPLANAIFKAKVGDVINFRTPKGMKEIEIVEIKYINLQ